MSAYGGGRGCGRARGNRGGRGGRGRGGRAGPYDRLNAAPNRVAGRMNQEEARRLERVLARRRQGLVVSKYCYHTDHPPRVCLCPSVC